MQALTWGIQDSKKGFLIVSDLTLETHLKVEKRSLPRSYAQTRVAVKLTSRSRPTKSSTLPGSSSIENHTSKLFVTFAILGIVFSLTEAAILLAT